jgi:F-type H+-transporting ATPase subunit gamma
MASTQQLKRRIGSVKNTKQITKAMELVAASKMRRAQENALRSRDFRNLARAILSRIAELTDVTQHPLYAQRTVKNRLYIVVTGDRGLAGAYNSNVLRHITAALQEDRDVEINSQIIVIGKQGSRFMARFKDVTILAAYHDFPEYPSANDIHPILTTIIDAFRDKEVDAVDLVYTDYKSSITQVVTSQRLLPAAIQKTEIPKGLEKAIFEPSVQAVLDGVTERLIEVQLSQALLESRASEHSMRMLAMKSASDNASEIIDDLTLEFNSARQASITQELAEITGGAEAIAA